MRKTIIEKKKFSNEMKRKDQIEYLRISFFLPNLNNLKQ